MRNVNNELYFMEELMQGNSFRFRWHNIRVVDVEQSGIAHNSSVRVAAGEGNGQFLSKKTFFLRRNFARKALITVQIAKCSSLLAGYCMNTILDWLLRRFREYIARFYTLAHWRTRRNAQYQQRAATGSLQATFLSFHACVK